MPELSYHQPHQPPEQSYAENLRNRLKPQAEKIIAEEQAGFRPGRSTTEQIFNLRILCKKTTVGVRQGCVLTPTLFNIFLERIMTDALNDHEGTIRIGGRKITNLRFAGDIDGLAGREEELTDLVECLDKASTAFDDPSEKTKLMTNNTNGISTDIRVNSGKLDCVNRFKYLGAIIADEGRKPKILARTTAALAKLKTFWNGRNIVLSSKIRLMRSLVMSIFLYACESWTLTADTERRITCHGDEMPQKALRHNLQRPHLQQRGAKQNSASHWAPRRPLDHSKATQTEWYRHVTRSTGLAKTILQGTVQGGRRRGRQKKDGRTTYRNGIYVEHFQK
ncbi:hypothetical protein NP493_11g04006 [Ridgeia piscesae]|uniref:Reverse transcriptase domain-containing protein n=1 Tax=Ridgeia piscesae TaxID=27915 RepID=A0AAD9ULF3_RIDPI|nr:hypothetical protein NP493_11g04006 [Ridgeia piscesae]